MAGKSIFELFAEGKTAEVLKLLSTRLSHTAKANEVAMLQSEYNHLLKEKDLISNETFNLYLRQFKDRISRFFDSLDDKAFLYEPLYTAGHPADHQHRFQIFRCDRIPQTQAFEKAYILNCDTDPLQFFVVHGNKAQSPRSLCQRLHAYEIPKHVMEVNPLQTINYEGEEDIDYLKKWINQELNTLFFPGNLPKLDFEHISEYAKSPIFQRYKGIVVGIRIEERHWRPCFVQFLDWFIHQFCDQSRYSNSTKVLFIIQIDYDEPETSWSVWPFSRKSKEPDLSASLRLIKKLNILPKLGPVSDKDVFRWLEDILAINYIDQKELYKKHFGQAKELPMAEVEKQLEQIIQEWNHF